MSLASSLYDDNPWWIDQKSINNESRIKEWYSSSIKWDPRIRQTFDFTNDILYSLRGPRQVGKTTLLKLQIREFLAKGVNPWNIMYYAFDVDNSSKNIVEITENYLTNTARRRGRDRTFLFLDEVSKVKNWQDGIKRLKDAGKLDNCTIIVTGSHMIDLKKSLENLTGRRGKTDEAYDKIILPMKFSEYVPLVDARIKVALEENQISKRGDRKSIITKLLNGEIAESLYNIQSHTAELNLLLSNYMLTGGIPQVVNRYHEKGFLDDYLYSTYLDYILGDLKSLKKNQTLFRQLIANITRNISWPQSWLSLQKDTDIKNPLTVSDYVDDLTNMFVLTRFYSYDPIKKRILLRKNKKIHFHDPFFLHAINSWLSGEKPFRASQTYVENEANQGSLVEGIVGDHLIRLAFNLVENKQNYDYSNYVSFWNIKKGREVDYVLHMGNEIQFPIEVKYRNQIESKHGKGIGYFNALTKNTNALILSKTDLKKSRDTVILPASIFLLLV